MEVINSPILQSHRRFNMPEGVSCHARICVSFPFAKRDSLHNNTPFSWDYQRSLNTSVTITKKCRKRFMTDFFNCNCLILLFKSAISIFVILKTGPSVHTHKLPSTVSVTQQQAKVPNPQAIIFSRETSHAIFLLWALGCHRLHHGSRTASVNHVKLLFLAIMNCWVTYAFFTHLSRLR